MRLRRLRRSIRRTSTSCALSLSSRCCAQWHFRRAVSKRHSRDIVCEPVGRLHFNGLATPKQLLQQSEDAHMTGVAFPLCAPNRAAVGISAVRAVRVSAWLDRCPSAPNLLEDTRHSGCVPLLRRPASAEVLLLTACPRNDPCDRSDAVAQTRCACRAGRLAALLCLRGRPFKRTYRHSWHCCCCCCWTNSISCK